uniref:Uncharacterized protein n=1 Tax=Arundo donax TaxID=35708 RepID=A0A0A8XRR4_ARUDO
MSSRCLISYRKSIA